MPSKTARRRQRRDDDDDDGAEWLCFYCEESIELYEPFAMVSIRTTREVREAKPALCHESCKIDVIASQIVEHVLDSQEEGKPAVGLEVEGVRAGASLRDKLKVLGKDYLAAFVADVFEEDD